jgi:DNA-binding phage protein
MPAASPWSILYYLDTEEKIAEHIEGTLQDVEEGECDAHCVFLALSDAVMALKNQGGINRLAKEMGVDRKLFYDFDNFGPDAKLPKINPDAIAKVIKNLAAAQPA